MHGRQSEERQRQRHMWPVSALATVSDSPCNKFFYKDGRKISIGDCALFQAGNAPPFIGIIRYLTGDKEGHTKLGVNWLYRPADVKLGKGVLLEAAPNEVFYSFHKDEISAASLLHPCKVAFLRKGIELPSGVSSFVCRRVYDTTNKCLWWLTDQDYTNVSFPVPCLAQLLKMGHTYWHAFDANKVGCHPGHVKFVISRVVCFEVFSLSSQRQMKSVCEKLQWIRNVSDAVQMENI